MRLHTEQHNVDKSGQLVEREFQIKANAQAFSILSSGLYSDKILAIVRELSCNAWDAHVTANNLDTNFEIKLPTSLDPTFHVKDFGTGLSDYDVRGGWYNKTTKEKVSLLECPSAIIAPREGFEQVGGLYNTYFESSKQQRNDLIGALGLGSKSPFSYVSTFTVESRIGGVRYLYSAYVNDKGVPAITLLGHEKTTEPNGMTIAFGTKQGDADKFKSAAQKALMYFDPLPTVLGTSSFAPYSLKHTVKGTNWRVREVDYMARTSGAQVMQGFVAYPIDREILRQSNLANLSYSILGLDIDFFVPLGQVNPAASREALSYTAETIANLQKVVEVAALEMRASIQKAFDECKSLWDARLLHADFEDYNNKMKGIFKELHNIKPFTYKGANVDDHFPLDLTKITNTHIQIVSMSSFRHKVTRAGSWDPTNFTKTHNIHLHAGITVLVDDTHKSKGILSQYLDAQKAPTGTRSSDKYAIILKGVTKTSYSASEIGTIIKQLGNPNFTLVSTLPYTRAAKTGTYRARKSDEVVVWKGYPENGGYRRDQLRRVYSRLCWNGAKVDPYDAKTDRIYVGLERFTIVQTFGGQEVGSFDEYLNAMVNAGILAAKPAIIGLNEKQTFRIKKSKNWSNLFTFCKDKFAELNKTGALTDKVVAYRVMSSIGNGIAKHIVLNWTTIRPKIVDGEFKTTIDKIHDVLESSRATKLTPEAIGGVAHRTDSTFVTTVDTNHNKLVNEFNKTMSKHAMMRLVDWDKVSAKDVDMIIEYVNFVAKS